jgi:hypothetical protein
MSVLKNLDVGALLSHPSNIRDVCLLQQYESRRVFISSTNCENDSIWKRSVWSSYPVSSSWSVGFLQSSVKSCFVTSRIFAYLVLTVVFLFDRIGGL